MRIEALALSGWRNLDSQRWEPGPGFNALVGANGAGKSNLVEAVHLLGHGRSFRTSDLEGLVRRGHDGFVLQANVREASGSSRHVGMGRGTEGWELRVDDRSVPTLVEFVRQLPVVTMDPESHRLVTGPAEERRRFLDWLLFHVEPTFLGIWRRYLRALRQRNAALRSGGVLAEAWEHELAVQGSRIDEARRRQLEAVQPRMLRILGELLPGLAASGVRFRAGWPAGLTLAQALADGRISDRQRGFTQRGPHRSDWRLVLGEDVVAPSRGQAKLAALACQLAQAECFREAVGHWPLLCCDDLAAELDPARQGLLLGWLAATGSQVLVTGTARDPRWEAHAGARLFHVEQGRIHPLL